MRITARLLFLASVICLLASPVKAGVVNATYQFSDFTTAPESVKRITLTPLQPFADYGGAILSARPLVRTTDTNGSYTFTNLVAGYSYRYELATPFNAVVGTNGFPSDLSGAVNAADYRGVWVGQVFAYFRQLATNAIAAGDNIVLSQSSVTNPVTISVTNLQPASANLTNWSGLDVATVFAQNNSLFVMKNGSDSTGTRGRVDKPFLTITAAVVAAQAGDTVYVLAGTYPENNLLKSSVNYYFYPGTVINYMESTTGGAAYGIFDDRTTGATTNRIDGYLDIVWNAGTNFFVYDTNNCLYVVGNTNALGAIVTTNAATSLSYKGGRIGVSGFYTVQYALYVAHCTNSFFQLDEIYDPYFGLTVSTNAGGLCDVLTQNGASGAIYWELGDMYVDCKVINDMTTYALDAYGGSNTVAANFWLTSELIKSKIYVVGFGSPNYKTWVRAKEVRTPSGVNAFEYHGSGKHYAEWLKASATNTQTILTASNGAFGGLELWLTGQKVSGNQVWIDHGCGSIYANINHFEDTAGTVDGGILVRTNATLRLKGGLAASAGKTVEFRAGRAFLEGWELRSTNNVAVLATNSGCILQNCLLISKTTSNSIESAAFSVNVGTVPAIANRPKSANVTTSPLSSFTVDSALQ